MAATTLIVSKDQGRSRRVLACRIRVRGFPPPSFDEVCRVAMRRGLTLAAQPLGATAATCSSRAGPDPMMHNHEPTLSGAALAVRAERIDTDSWRRWTAPAGSGLLREGGRPDGPVAMTRSLFHDAAGWAWLGIDAPVPGVMAPCFDDDQRLVATLLTAAAGRGARQFVSDIEQPSPGRDTEPYRRWAELGFEAVYRRHLFTRPPRQGADRTRST